MNDPEAGTNGAAYDVFLNQSGPDVMAMFVAHLHDALRRAGLRPLLDARSLMKRNPALKSIDQALDMARVHVVVVSKRYAESTYCLNELVAVMRSGKPVVPVFYGVEPVDLRWVEKGPFAEAFETHEMKGRAQKKVQEWRDALRALAEITGFCLSAYKSDEAKLKREVVAKIARLLPSNEPVKVEQYRVGLEAPTNECKQILDNMGAGVGILGLVGMGGIGKTTLAREIYNRCAAQKEFKYMTYLEIDRDNSNVQVRPTWSKELRNQVLWDLLRVQTSASNNYTSWFQKSSAMGPVLIVIDDIHKLGQFESIIPFANDLHAGSRIVITSRDESIFNNVAGRAHSVVHHLFKVSNLYPSDSNKLFNLHAFQAEEAPEDYKELAEDIVNSCGGLPLALKVIGSSLYDKRTNRDRESIWPEAVRALAQSRDVMDVLRWSYDTLTESEKHMFVDVTCLFDNRPLKVAKAYWKSCEDCASCGGVQCLELSLRNLLNKNLVVMKDNSFRSETSCLTVHDLLRDLGQDIAKKAKSHFVNNQIAEAVIRKNHGTEKTMALNLEGSRKRKFETEDFANMPNLHFLVLPDGCNLNGGFRCISKKLRWLQWRSTSFDHLPEGLNTSHLVMLDFSKSTKLAYLWTESKGNLEACPNLRQLYLNGCTSINYLPQSIGNALQLQCLELNNCKRLIELPESIGQLKALESLALSGCSILRALPTSIGHLKALKKLSLSECWHLKALPDSMGALSNLRILYTNRCPSLMNIPLSIGLLSSLERLHIGGTAECLTFSNGFGEAWTRLSFLGLYNCCRLGSLFNYRALQSLGSLEISNCKALIDIPESIGHLKCLWRLRIALCIKLEYLPNSIGDLNMLRELVLWVCDNLKRLPETLGKLRSLMYLEIEECPIRMLPRSTGQLTRLLRLKLKKCTNLQKLPTSITQLKHLDELQVRDCGSIETMGVLTTLQGLPIWGSTSITKLPASLGIVSNLLVCRGKYVPWDCQDLFQGAGQVVEDDESEFLKTYQIKSSGVTITTLLRNGMRNINVRWFPKGFLGPTYLEY